ncbi:unnamed protein product [marine sediment metagenome]|uniref:Uncharacterized protein n=1 Tax=marine sediment metagenome TaxID=412755 RepID=X1CB95_9ZZZZ
MNKTVIFKRIIGYLNFFGVGVCISMISKGIFQGWIILILLTLNIINSGLKN